MHFVLPFLFNNCSRKFNVPRSTKLFAFIILEKKLTYQTGSFLFGGNDVTRFGNYI